MKLTKLIQIENELIRTQSKLKQAINKAMQNDHTTWRYNEATGTHENGHYVIPERERECTNTKESASFKRSAMDLKRELSNL